MAWRFGANARQHSLERVLEQLPAVSGRRGARRELNGANFMNVGVELNQLAENPGNNAAWTSVIGAVAANFNGKLGYAANWDDYSNPTLVNNIWQNPHISYMGVDAYFP